MTNEENLLKLESLAHLAFKNLIADEDSKQYVLKKFAEYDPADEGEKRVFVEKPNAARLSAALKDIDSSDLYVWIGFLELVGGPNEFTNEFRKLQTQIAEENLGLVYAIAHSVMRNCNATFEIDDLVSEGFMGMRYAIELYDKRYGFKFSTYATTWIRQFMNRYVLRYANLVRVPETVARARIKDGTVTQTKSLHAPIGDDGDSLMDDLPSRDAPVDRSTEISEEADKLHRIFSKLDEREQKIIQMRYGLFGSPAMTLCDIGQQMNICRERVRQIEAKALRRLKIMGGSI